MSRNGLHWYFLYFAFLVGKICFHCCKIERISFEVKNAQSHWNNFFSVFCHLVSPRILPSKNTSSEFDNELHNTINKIFSTTEHFTTRPNAYHLSCKPITKLYHMYQYVVSYNGGGMLSKLLKICPRTNRFYQLLAHKYPQQVSSQFHLRLLYPSENKLIISL